MKKEIEVYVPENIINGFDEAYTLLASKTSPRSGLIKATLIVEVPEKKEFTNSDLIAAQKEIFDRLQECKTCIENQPSCNGCNYNTFDTLLGVTGKVRK